MNKCAKRAISDGKPLKIAQHPKLDNVKSFTFYVHTSLCKSAQALMQERIFWGACKSVLKSFYVFFFYVLFFGAIFKQFVTNFHSSSQLCHESFLAKYGILKMKFSAERLLVLDGWSWLCRMTSWTNRYSEKKLLHKEHLGTSRII